MSGNQRFITLTHGNITKIKNCVPKESQRFPINTVWDMVGMWLRLVCICLVLVGRKNFGTSGRFGTYFGTFLAKKNGRLKDILKSCQWGDPPQGLGGLLKRSQDWKLTMLALTAAPLTVCACWGLSSSRGRPATLFRCKISSCHWPS